MPGCTHRRSADVLETLRSQFDQRQKRSAPEQWLHALTGR
jgi:hypothetical protein